MLAGSRVPAAAPRLPRRPKLRISRWGARMIPPTRTARIRAAEAAELGAGARDGEASNRAVDVGKKAHSNIGGMGFFAFRRSKEHPPHRCSCADRAPRGLKKNLEVMNDEITTAAAARLEP